MNSAMEDHKSNEAKLKGKGKFPSNEIGPDYEYIEYIGSGSYGDVCKASQVKTGRVVAIKKFTSIFRSNTNTLRLLRELRILRALKGHPKIIRLLDIILPKDLIHFSNIYIVMEYMDTDLARIIKSDQFLTALHIKFVLYQILLATKCIHSAKIFHRDLKPQNILINSNCVSKICDFGLSRGAPTGKEDPTRRKLTSHVVTRWYRAPEVIFLTNKYTTSIDIWSIGCIFSELLGMQKESMSNAKSRMPLFPGISCYPLSPRSSRVEGTFFLDQISIILHVIGTPSEIEMDDFGGCSGTEYLNNLPRWSGIDLPKKFPAASEKALNLLLQMLRFSPSKRCSVDEALAHPYLADVREKDQEVSYPTVEFEFEGKSMKRQGRGLLIREIMKHKKGVRQNITRVFNASSMKKDRAIEKEEEKANQLKETADGRNIRKRTDITDESVYT